MDNIVKLHFSGATVQHKSPFDDLVIVKNNFELSKLFIQEWVIPFYRNITNTDENFYNLLLSAKTKINKEIIITLLGDFNWRTRQTGAYFAAITDDHDFIDVIGTHLIKSEVSYAGSIYAIVLANFNTTKSINYLKIYLDYYLKQNDLYFDQKIVLEAIKYLDKLNGTYFYSLYHSTWLEFVKDKQGWDEELDTKWIENQILFIKKFSDNVNLHVYKLS